MAKKNSLAYYANQLRKQGARRVARLEAAMHAEGATKRTREWAKAQIKEINSAIQGTRMYSKEGKRYKSKTQGYIAKQMTRLATAISEVEPRYELKGDPFEVTQRELNLASVKAPSVYTQKEVKLFYRATQKIWQRAGVGEHDRNEAILDHYNAIRKENGLSPLTLDQIVEYVLKANDKAQKQQIVEPSEDMTDEEKEAFERAQREDRADSEAGSPPGIGQAVINQIRDALDNLQVLPKNILFSKNPQQAAKEAIDNPTHQKAIAFIDSELNR